MLFSFYNKIMHFFSYNLFFIMQRQISFIQAKVQRVNLTLAWNLVVLELLRDRLYWLIGLWPMDFSSCIYDTDVLGASSQLVLVGDFDVIERRVLIFFLLRLSLSDVYLR